MYVVKKCDNYSRGRNDWQVIYTSPYREAAISVAREEYRLLLNSDPDMSSKDIQSRMDDYSAPKSGAALYGRKQFGHKNTKLAIMKSYSVDYKPAVLPDKNEALYSILSR
jgi:hypothetical protein